MTSTDEMPAISTPKVSSSKRQSSCSLRTKLSARQSPPNYHTILLLSDSALPLGSFAFSSGLESYLAHTTTSSSYSTPSTLPNFLSLSLHSLCTTSLPHLLAAHSHPQHINEIDTIFDASTLCPVARRASIAQGRALLTLWDRAFRDSSSGGGRDEEEEEEEEEEENDDDYEQGKQHNNINNNNNIKASGTKKIKRDIKYKKARDVLAKFSLALKKASFVMGGIPAAKSSSTTTTTTAEQQRKSNKDDNKTDNSFEEEEQYHHRHHHPLEAPNGHFPPLWGLVTQALRISARDSVYVFLLNHAKSVVSAAVRASLMGPYQAQGLLGSVWLRKELERLMDRVGVEEEEQEEEEEKEEEEEGDGWKRRVEEAGQGVPAMDIWLGRHELLYSRIFNS